MIVRCFRFGKLSHVLKARRLRVGGRAGRGHGGWRRGVSCRLALGADRGGCSLGRWRGNALDDKLQSCSCLGFARAIANRLGRRFASGRNRADLLADNLLTLDEDGLHGRVVVGVITATDLTPPGAERGFLDKQRSAERRTRRALSVAPTHLVGDLRP